MNHYHRQNHCNDHIPEPPFLLSYWTTQFIVCAGRNLLITLSPAVLNDCRKLPAIDPCSTWKTLPGSERTSLTWMVWLQCVCTEFVHYMSSVPANLQIFTTIHIVSESREMFWSSRVLMKRNLSPECWFGHGVAIGVITSAHCQITQHRCTCLTTSRKYANVRESFQE